MIERSFIIQMNISKQTSESLRALAFFCALLVVPIHCFSPATWLSGDAALRTWEAAVAFLFTDTLSRCAVPCFFVMSGFFLALKYEPSWSWYRTTLRKRCVTLYIPFLIWNILYLCRNSLLEHQNLFNLQSIFGYNPFVSPGFGLFWYVQVVLFAVLLAPLWLPIFKKPISAALVLVVLSAAWLTGNFGHFLSLQLQAGNFLWLAVGATAAFNLPKLRTPVRSIRLTVALLLAAAIALHVVAACLRHQLLMRITDYLTIAFGVFTLFSNSARLLAFLKPLQFAFSLAFFIYAMHPQGLLIHIPLDHLGTPFIVTYFARIVAGISVPLVIGLLMRHFTPRVLSWLTGARGGG